MVHSQTTPASPSAIWSARSPFIAIFCAWRWPGTQRLKEFVFRSRSAIRSQAAPGPSSGTALMEDRTKAHPERQENLVKKVSLGRVGDPDDVARAAIWLCSDDAAFITGHALSVDGGLAVS